MKRQLSVLLAAALLLGSLSGCGDKNSTGDTVPVQTVASVLGIDLSGNNRYSGVVESKTLQSITKDDEKQVSQVNVEVGDEVKKGDVLFSYDVESLQLSVETARLELEQMQNNITSYQTQIEELNKEKKKASSSEKLSYSIQIQETQLSLSEEQYNLKKKQAELADLEKALEHTDVVAEVDGIVKSIQDGSSTGGAIGYEDGGSQDAFMTILETGVFQVKGTVSEMNIGELYEGMQMTVRSRMDETKFWSGTISEVNTDSTQAESGDAVGYVEDGGGESASKYSFTVALDSSDGLMIGQHVYIEQGAAPSGNGLNLYSSYIVQEGDAAYVWAADDGGKLEKRTVTLGNYDELMDTYEITDGLTLEDEIAVPSENLQEGAAVSLYEDGGEESGDGSFGEEGMIPEEGMMEDEGFVGDGSSMGEEMVPEEGMMEDNGDFADEGAAVDGNAMAEVDEA